jgi:hypothetical protein
MAALPGRMCPIYGRQAMQGASDEPSASPAYVALRECVKKTGLQYAADVAAESTMEDDELPTPYRKNTMDDIREAKL